MQFTDSSFADFGGAVKDIFGAVGDAAESGSYGEAAKYADQNAAISAESTKIQEYQAGRETRMGLGKIIAGSAANGLTSGGSAGDILRASASQGALQQQVIAEQGNINETSYHEQAAQYRGMATAAKAAAAGQAGGGLLSGLGGFLSIFGGGGGAAAGGSGLMAGASDLEFLALA